HHVHLPSFPTRRSSDLRNPGSASRRRHVMNTTTPGFVEQAMEGIVFVRQRIELCGGRHKVDLTTGKKPPRSIYSDGSVRYIGARSEEHTSELQSRENLV